MARRIELRNPKGKPLRQLNEECNIIHFEGESILLCILPEKRWRISLLFAMNTFMKRKCSFCLGITIAFTVMVAPLLHGEDVNVLDYGAIGNGVADDTLAIQAAMVAAGKGEVFFPSGVYLTNGISLNGVMCSIRGSGEGTRIKIKPASAIPVLDFTGYKSPTSAKARRHFRDFSIEGNNVPGSTGNAGIKISSLSSVDFSGISVENTGGVGLDLGSSILCGFYNLVVSTPAGAKTYDVPYIRAQGAFNGNRLIGIGLRSVTSANDVGSSGAVVITDNGVYAPHHNLFLAWWYEYLHISNNGTYFHLAGHSNIISDFQFFDVSREAGANSTSYFRLVPPSVQDSGGNVVRGLIPGRGTNADYSIGTGVDIRQSRNRVEGVRGYRDSNVTLARGVEYTYVTLGGRVSGVRNNSLSAFVDNSGKQSNTLIDAADGIVEQNVPFQMTAIPDQGAPPANSLRFFARSNGGKMQLVVRFPTGAVQVIATEP